MTYIFVRILHILKAFALASALFHAGRFTTLTTSRTIQCLHRTTRYGPLRSALRPYSTPTRRLKEQEEGGEKDTQSALDILRNLLPASTPREKRRGSVDWEGKQEIDEERLQAEFVPKFRQYVPNTPSERWQRRKKLVSRVGGEARDESNRASVPDSPRQRPRPPLDDTRLGEIAWTSKHLAALEPPCQTQEKNRAYRSHTHTRKAMRSFAQLLTTPSADTPGTTLLLHFDSKRYLVGALAEGTQRACVQMGARLLKVQECFLTGRTEWRNTGGLIGMILTLADAAQTSRESSVEEAVSKARGKGKRMGLAEGGSEMQVLVEEARRGVKDAKLTVFGPGNLNHAMATARRFVFRKGMPVDLHEVRDRRAKGAEEEVEGEDEWAPYWADENIKVWPMSISPTPARPANTNGVGTVSPRKRSIDEVYLDERAKTTSANGSLHTPATDLSQADKDALTSKAVVGEMFNSSWRLDTLYETPLSQVNLPATIFVRNPDTKKVEKYRGPLPGSGKEIPDPDMTVLVRKPWPGALVESLPPTQPKREAVSYIIKNHVQRGRFYPEKAMECKVEKGQKWSQLQKGMSVENADGETVTPEMVLGEPKEGNGIAVLEVPDPTYIDALLARPEWRERKVMNGVGTIVWSCGEGVVGDERVQRFMRQEMKDLKHVVSSPECCPNNISLDSATAATIRLGKVDPKRYNVPVHDNEVAHPPALPENAVVAQRGLVVQMEPKMELQTNQVVPPLSIAEVESEMPSEVSDEAAKSQQAITASANDSAITAWKSSIPSPDAEITTLGTGSALPSKYRNVSATLVRVPGWGNILLDCGENTLGQLKRVFPAAELKQILQDLRILVISHMHADHHLGTVGVLKAWYHEVHAGVPLPPPAPGTPVQDLLAPDQPQRLAVISEPAMQHWLTEYAAIEDFGLSCLTPLVISPAKPYRDEPSQLNWFISPRQLSTLPDHAAALRDNAIPPSLIGLADAQAVLVTHCHGARAVALTLPSGFKVSYSGDCRPSRAFSAIGKGSTVCIHEATFDDELRGDAQAKNHSTTSEALRVAQEMQAKCCVLTHFSQRYQKMPVMEYAGNGASAGGAGEDVAGGEERAPTATFDAEGMLQDYTAADDDADNNDPETAAPPDVTDPDVAHTFPDQPTTSTSTYTPLTPSSATAPQAPAPVKFTLQSDMQVAVAFDYMRLRVGETWEMQRLVPALLRLFEEEERKGVVAKGAAGEKEGKGGKKDGKEKGKRVKGRGSRESLR